MKRTAQSEVGTLQKLLLKHPKDAFRSQEYIDANWRQLNYLAPPDFTRALNEYDKFVEVFLDRNIEVEFLPFSEGAGLDSIYVRDASIITDEGAIICNMGKEARAAEPGDQLKYFLSHGISILDTYSTPATIEGGDVAWLSERVLAVAHGYRTNAAGIALLKRLAADSVAEILVMDSPHYKGPGDVFHLMSVLSPVDYNKAVVYSPLMTVPFRNKLLEMDIEFIEVPDEEFESLGCNVLALSPGVCLMVEGNPVTRSRLESAGVEVIEYAGREISLKGSGGPTCLTRPLIRDI